MQYQCLGVDYKYLPHINCLWDSEQFHVKYHHKATLIRNMLEHCVKCIRLQLFANRINTHIIHNGTQKKMYHFKKNITLWWHQHLLKRFVHIYNCASTVCILINLHNYLGTVVCHLYPIHHFTSHKVILVIVGCGLKAGQFSRWRTVVEIDVIVCLAETCNEFLKHW